MQRPYPFPIALIFALALTHLHALASPVGWAWTGGVTPDSATITARIDTPAVAGLQIQGGAIPIQPVLTVPMEKGTLHRFDLTGLEPDTAYTYQFVDGSGAPLDQEPRSLRTAPVDGKPASFRFAVSSCARVANSPAFAAIARQAPRFLVHTGDFHYANIGENRVERFRKAYNYHLSGPAPAHLAGLRAHALHLGRSRFRANDSNMTSPSREASLRNFRELVPHYPLTVDASPGGPVNAGI